MFPDRLRKARKERKLTQEELAALVNTKKTTISNYETGYSSPSNEMLNDLATVLGVTTDYLLGRTSGPDMVITTKDGKTIMMAEVKYTPRDEKKKHSHENPYDSLTEITKYVQQLGFTSMGFFDIEKWKNLTPDDVEIIKRNFDTVVEIAEKRKKQQGN